MRHPGEVVRLGPLFVTVERHQDRVFLDVFHAEQDEGLASVRLDVDGANDPGRVVFSVAVFSEALQGDEGQTLHEFEEPSDKTWPACDCGADEACPECEPRLRTVGAVPFVSHEDEEAKGER